MQIVHGILETVPGKLEQLPFECVAAFRVAPHRLTRVPHLVYRTVVKLSLALLAARNTEHSLILDAAFAPLRRDTAEAFVKTLKPSLQRRLYRAVLSAATECPSLVQDVDAGATRLLSTQMAVVQPEHAEAFHLSVRSPLVGACVSGCASRPLRHR